MTRAALTAAALALALAACGGEESDPGPAASEPVRICSINSPPSDGWTGNPQPDPETGAVSVSGFNEFLAGAGEPINTSPCDAARVFLHLDRPTQEGEKVDVTVDPPESPSATATITIDNLSDDSVEAEQWILTFEPRTEETIQLTSAKVAYRCQEGRGHRDFTPELCA